MPMEIVGHTSDGYPVYLGKNSKYDIPERTPEHKEFVRKELAGLSFAQIDNGGYMSQWKMEYPKKFPV